MAFCISRTHWSAVIALNGTKLTYIFVYILSLLKKKKKKKKKKKTLCNLTSSWPSYNPFPATISRISNQVSNSSEESLYKLSIHWGRAVLHLWCWYFLRVSFLAQNIVYHSLIIESRRYSKTISSEVRDENRMRVDIDIMIEPFLHRYQLQMTHQICQKCLKFKFSLPYLNSALTGVEWVHCLFLFPLVLGKS